MLQDGNSYAAKWDRECDLAFGAVALAALYAIATLFAYASFATYQGIDWVIVGIATAAGLLFTYCFLYGTSGGSMAWRVVAITCLLCLSVGFDVWYAQSAFTNSLVVLFGCPLIVFPALTGLIAWRLHPFRPPRDGGGGGGSPGRHSDMASREDKDLLNLVAIAMFFDLSYLVYLSYSLSYYYAMSATPSLLQ